VNNLIALRSYQINYDDVSLTGTTLTFYMTVSNKIGLATTSEFTCTLAAVPSKP